MMTKDAISILQNLRLRAATLDERAALEVAIDALKRQPDFQNIGRKGGLATKATHSPEYFRRIGKLGGRPKKKHNGNPSQNR